MMIMFRCLNFCSKWKCRIHWLSQFVSLSVEKLEKRGIEREGELHNFFPLSSKLGRIFHISGRFL